MRLIPRNTKVKMQFYKGITLCDIVLALLCLTLLALVISSNFTYKYVIALVILCCFIPLFVSIGKERIYISIFYLFKYAASKKRFSKTENTSADMAKLVPYQCCENNLIKNKDDSYTGIIKITPINFHLLSQEKQIHLIDRVLSNILNSLTEHQSAEFIKIDKELNLDSQLQAELARMARLIELSEKGIITKNEYTTKMDIIQDRIEIIDQLNGAQSTINPSYYFAITDADDVSLLHALDDIKQQLDCNGIKSFILKCPDLSVLLKLSNEKADNINFGLTYTTKDGQKLSHFVIDEYPLKVGYAWAEDIFNIPNTKITMKFKPVEKEKAIKRIDNTLMEISMQKKGKASKVIDNTTHMETLSYMLAGLQNDNETLFDVTLIITAYDEKNSSTTKKLVKRKLKENGFIANEMFGRQIDAYLSSTICSYENTNISVGIPTSSLAACFPFVDNSILDNNGLLIGENTNPVFIDLFKRDSNYVNSNMVVLGKSGSGKSYSIKTILGHLASCNTKIYIFDPENEYGHLTENLHGKVLDVSSNKYGIINPFHILHTLQDEKPEDANSSYYSHLQFLESFFKTALPGISPDCLELLNTLLISLYKTKKISSKSNFKKINAKDYPTFDDLMALIEEKSKAETDESLISCYKHLTNHINKFGTGGRYSNLWNGTTSLEIDSNIICFNFQHLLTSHNETLANAQMLLLLRWLESEIINNKEFNKIHNDSRKIIVAIDEAHLFVDPKYPLALDFMHQLSKRIRKYDGMQIVATQSIKDFAGTPELSQKAMSIINESQYSFIFALSPNDINDLCKLYEKAGKINDSECETITHNPRGCAFLISSPENRTALRIVATPFLESLFETKEQKEN